MVLIRWLGHAAFVINAGGATILVDPWISNPLSPYRSVDSFAKEYRFVDYIIVTHDHGDHVGEAVELLSRFKDARIVAVFELAEELAKRTGAGERSIPANIGGRVKLEKGLEVVFTPAFHSSTKGAPTGVVIFGEGKAIYHAGDTGIFSDMRLIAELYKPHVALLPIGGHFTMGVEEAVKAVELLKPRIVVPMHYNTFNVIVADPLFFAKLVKESIPGVEVKVLSPGQLLEV
jgi:L-ascorbate metabolism protein UlaG (beta-lactamase superfamily)